MRALLTAAVVAVLVVPPPLVAQQDTPEPEKHESIAWEKKFAEMVGGEAKAREIGEKYDSYIERSNVTMAMQDDELMLSLKQ